MRVFLDANVLFSAARSDGAVRALLKALREAGHALVADAFVEEEARRNLLAKAGDAALDALDALLTVVEVAGTTPVPAADSGWLLWLPEKDRPVLAAAAALRCQVLVTGDRTHFGAGYGKQFAGVTIHAPASAAMTLLS